MKMKSKVLTVACALLLAAILLLIYICGHSDDEIVSSLPQYASREYRENGAFKGERMAYAIYTYEKLSMDDVVESGFFSKPDTETLSLLKACVKDYEKRIDGYLEAEGGYFKDREFARRFPFFSEYIEPSDYCCVLLNDNSYSVYYYLENTKTLYCMYADIIDPITVDEAQME
ncbi:MAG: hypothetical protein IKB34_02270 [Clostridia bacterium]|nr:hypothetical protein [Clostridia bacterium]